MVADRPDERAEQQKLQLKPLTLSLSPMGRGDIDVDVQLKASGKQDCGWEEPNLFGTLLIRGLCLHFRTAVKSSFSGDAIDEQINSPNVFAGCRCNDGLAVDGIAAGW